MRPWARYSVNHGLAVLLLALPAGCDGPPPATTAIEPAAVPPIGGIDGGEAVLPLGVVVAFTVTANGGASQSNTVSVDDPGLVSIASTPDPSTYALIGLSAGKTTLRAAAQGATTAAMALTVMRQTPAP